MTENVSRLRQIGTDMDVPEQTPGTDMPKVETSKSDKIATDLIILALKSLSQKTIIALSNLLTVATAASAFVLAYTLAPQPSVNQLIELVIYCCFVLLLHHVRKKP